MVSSQSQSQLQSKQSTITTGPAARHKIVCLSPRQSRICVIRRAFTLIELLVVLAVVTILIGLTLPALSGSRSGAVILKCQSNIRQVGLLMDEYAVRYNDLNPFAGFEPRTVSVPGDGSGGPVGGRIGIGQGMWSLLFADRWQHTYIWDRSLRCPEQVDFDPAVYRSLNRDGPSTPINYAVLAYPNYWIGSPFWTNPLDMKLDADRASLRTRPIRHADVRFPSRKVLATEFWVFCSNEPNRNFKLYTTGDTASLAGSTLACDGSVRRIARSKGLGGLRGPYSFMDTPDGVWGLDLP